MDRVLIQKLREPDQYGNRRTLQSIADEFGVSRERIRQLAGNSGKWKPTETLRNNRMYWLERLYIKRDITRSEIAKIFRISESAVVGALGKRTAYEELIGLRVCQCCSIVYPLDQFYLLKSGRRMRRCKTCNTAMTMNWIRNNRERFNAIARDYNRRKKLSV